MRARDDDILHPAAQSPVGIAVLDALRAAVLRVAVASGGADSAMSEMQVTTFFNLSASHVATKRLYNGGLSLPSKLPWERAKALLAALLDSLSSARGADVGYRVGERLLQLPAPALDATAQADVAAMVSLVECNMSKRLSGLSEGDASSAASSSSTPPPSLPMPPLQPMQPAQPQPQMVPAEPVAPFVLDASAPRSAPISGGLWRCGCAVPLSNRRRNWRWMARWRKDCPCWTREPPRRSGSCSPRAPRWHCRRSERRSCGRVVWRRVVTAKWRAWRRWRRRSPPIAGRSPPHCSLPRCLETEAGVAQATSGGGGSAGGTTQTVVRPTLEPAL